MNQVNCPSPLEIHLSTKDIINVYRGRNTQSVIA